MIFYFRQFLSLILILLAKLSNKNFREFLSFFCLISFDYFLYSASFSPDVFNKRHRCFPPALFHFTKWSETATNRLSTSRVNKHRAFQLLQTVAKHGKPHTAIRETVECTARIVEHSTISGKGSFYSPWQKFGLSLPFMTCFSRVIRL